MPPFAPFSRPSPSSGRLLIGNFHRFHIHSEPGCNEIADEALLLGDAADRIDDFHAVLADDAIVFGENLPLEETKTIDRIRAPAQIHARLIKLQLDPPGQQALQRYLDGDAEVERKIG